MKSSSSRSPRFVTLWLALLLAGITSVAGAATPLADSPIGATVVVPANVALTLSVEWPTGDDDPYIGTSYVPATTYVGYWSPDWCYTYDTSSANGDGSAKGVFTPQVAASAHVCNGGGTKYWSGNFLNWALTQTIDPLRYALTGGYRSVDTSANTVLQKAYSDGSVDNYGFPDKQLSGNATIKGATPFASWTKLVISNRNLGRQFEIARTSPCGSKCGDTGGKTNSGLTLVTTYPGDATAGGYKDTYANAFKLYGAVQVCVQGKDYGDSRCRGYPYGSGSPTVYKPFGLMQKYAAETSSGTDTIRYSAFGYLFDTNLKRDGGVMRARMKSVGPWMANPGQPVKLNSAANNPVTKTSAEWSKDDGTFITNPDTSDASSYGPSGSSSGVINYLNQFGFAASAYKSYDPVGELYYAATRYYRGIGSVASYSSGLTTAMYDGFPVIPFAANNDGTNSNIKDDPIAYSCSKNYIVGIGDIHTHADANLPGRTYTTGNEPTMPTEVSNDLVSTTGVDAKKAADQIAMLENQISKNGGGGSSDYQLATGIGDNAIDNISSPTGGWCCNLHSFLMAGLAYDIHTRDIRQDIVNKAKPVTVSTFWLDVMETNDYHEKNQFWLTAKYGGFDTSQTDTNKNPLFSIIGKTSSTSASSDEYVRTKPLPTLWWNTGKLDSSSATKVDYVDSTGTVTSNTTYTGPLDDHGNLLPDQYFQASNPSKMIDGLNTAFSKIAASAPSGTSTSLAAGSNTFVASGNANYAVSYGSDWSGEVLGQSLSLAATGGALTGTTTNNWTASAWLPPNTTPTGSVTPLTYDTRIIATSSAPGAAKGVPFRVSSISTSETSALGSNAGNVLNYVRGDQCNEAASGTALSAACKTVTGNTTSLGFRDRPTSVLGDITNSKPAILAAPSFPYGDAPLNPGYAAFKTKYTNPDGSSARGTTIFVGSNDGMLHAFDGSVASGGSGGKERFAYVPSYLFNTNVDSNSNPVGLASLALGTSKSYKHHFMVDAQPVVYDVDFHATGGATTTTAAQSDWHSVLIGGLGKGGKGYFAIDVSDPTAISDETTLAGKILWETNPSSTGYKHMGYSYGTPIVVKTKTYGWTVVLTSGYNNDDGHGYIYLVNPKDGSLYTTIATPDAGTPTTPAGLTHVEAGIPNATDFTADALYAGDLLGNVWRVDLTNSSFAVTNLATLKALDNSAQPVTTKPALGIDPTSLKRYVFVGTGRLLDDSDLVSSQQQTFYAIQDGTNNAFDNTITAPRTRADLANDSGLSSGTNLTGVTLTATQKGFYIDLQTYAAGAGLSAGAERINIAPVATVGVVGFAANLYGRDVCVAGSSRVFALSFDSASGGGYAGTLLTSSGNMATNALSYSNGVVNSLTLGADGSGNMVILAGIGGNSATPGVQGGKFNPLSGNTMNKINWREVPEAQ